MSNKSPTVPGQKNAPGSPQTPRTKPSFKFLHIFIAIGFVLLFVGTYFLMESPETGDILFWLIASLFPYAALLALCLFCKGVPKIFCSKVGGIILLSLIVIAHLLVPLIAKILTILCGLALACLLLCIFFSFGPDGSVTTTGRRSDGSTYTETRYYYGDGKDEEKKAAEDFKNQGYRDIDQNTHNYGG